MKKKWLWLCVIAVVLSVFMNFPQAVRADEAEVIQIWSVDDLSRIAENPSANYILMNDLDLSSMAPDNDTKYLIEVFNGQFDGNGKKIIGVNSTLFGKVAEGAVIKNLHINGTSYEYTCIVRSNSGIIKNCYAEVTAVIPENAYVRAGNICYYNYESGIIDSCSATIHITGTSVEGSQYGGIVCANSGTVKNCTCEGDFTVTTLEHEAGFGGIVCNNTGFVEDCTNYCSVTGNVAAGGVVFYCNYGNSQITNCKNYGNFDVNMPEHPYTYTKPTGGIVSKARGLVKDCINYGDISVKDYSSVAGGIVGANEFYLIIDSCTNNGEIYGKKYAGGICGKMSFDSGSFNIYGEFICTSGIGIIKSCVNYGCVSNDWQNNKTNINISIVGYVYSREEIMFINNCKAYIDNELVSLDKDCFYNCYFSDNVVNPDIQEATIELNYYDKKKLTCDNASNLKWATTGEISVSSDGIVHADFSGSSVSMVGNNKNICTSYIVAFDSETGACDYCPVIVKNDGVTWEYLDGTLIFSGNGCLAYESYYPWKKYANDVTKVIVEEGVANIPIYAFWGFTKLQSVELSDSVVFLSPYCFAYCTSLKELRLPANLCSLQRGIISNTAIETLHIPYNNMAEIYSEAISDCKNLKSIVFDGEYKGGIWSIHSDFCVNCPNLESITVPDGCYTLRSIDGVMFQNTQYGLRLMCYPSAKKDEEYTVLEGTYYLCDGALNNKYLKRFYGCDSLLYIGSNNFVDLENSVSCENLELLEISKNVELFSSDISSLRKIEKVINNSAIDIPLGEKYKYTSLSTGEQVTVLKAGDSATKEKIIDTQSIKISGQDTVELGKELQLTAEVLPLDATDRNVIWTSNNQNIATVDANGIVKAHNKGKVVITATSADGLCSDSITITVFSYSVKISGSDTVEVGNELQLTAEILPSDATDRNVIWTSSNEYVATVDANGIVKAHRKGKVVITATYGDGICSDNITITVSSESQSQGYTGFVGIFWYENGVRQGVKYNEDGQLDLSYRGKEIYDPQTNAWYWLDNINEGAVAVSKDVYQESLAGEWGDMENEAGEKIGKWVRYDASGHMIKGWCAGKGASVRYISSPSERVGDEPVYYFDLVYGTMAKGRAVIDGKVYDFDQNTGVLIGEVYPDGWNIIDGVEYWYENGIRQGTEGRGKEIYDAASDAWYWLDSIDGGKKAVSKDVYQESYAGIFADREDGTGKWVRYDAQGHMIKGWSEQNGSTYYFDMQTGAMAKGEAEIDGVKHYFNMATGIMEW